MKTIRPDRLFFTLLCLLIAALAPAQDLNLKSPDGAINFHLTTQDKQLQFDITCNSKPVINASPLVFSLDNIPVTSHPATGNIQHYAIHESYPWMGAHSTAVNDCNGAQVNLLQDKTTFVLDIRVFNT